MDFVNNMEKSDGEHGPPQEIMEYVGKSFLFRTVGFSENDGGVRTYHINTLEDDSETVALHKPDHCIMEADDSDDDLTLLSRNATEVSSKQKPAFDDGEVMTPSSKRPLDVDDVDEDATPISQGSTNKKMKEVKIEKN